MSLLELLGRLERGRVAPVFASLSAGPLVEAVGELGVPVHVVTAPGDVVGARRAEFGLAGGGPLRAARRVFSTMPVIGRLAKLIRAESVELVYTNSSKAHVIGGFAGRRAGVPVVWHFRDYHVKPQVRLFFTGLAGLLADAVVCNSECTASQFKSHRNCRVVYNGLPPGKIRPSRPAEEVRAEFGLTESNVVVGTAGRLDRWKGIHTFVRAAATISREFPEARFFVVGGAIYGDGSYPGELEALARAEGVSDRVVFTGFREDVYDLMDLFDVYVHPSEEPEPFGRGIVESMFLGKPVVASRLGGPLEIVVEGGTGIFFDAGDPARLAEAVSSMLRDPARAATLGVNGRRRAETFFSIDRAAGEIARIITRQRK